MYLFVSISGFSQGLKRLHVGDKVPNVLLKEMVNYKSNSANLNEFLDKPLIIDMWFAECGSCIDAMPFLDTLQKEYKGKLNVVLSTFQSKEKAQKAFEITRVLENLKFTQTVSDSILIKLFPARLFPHQIWIDKNRTVIAITRGEYTNRQNIEKFIRGEKVDFPEKQDMMDHLMANGQEPLISYLYGSDKNKIFRYSYLSSYRSGFSALSRPNQVDTSAQTIRHTLINTWFPSLYVMAYRGEPDLRDFNLYTDFIRKDTLSIPSVPDFKNFTNIFCYDIIFHSSFKSRISEYMIADLDNAFNLKSHTEKRLITCYIIRPIGNKKKYLEPLFPTKKAEFQNQGMIKNIRIICNKYIPAFVRERFTSHTDKPVYFENLSKGTWNFEFVWNPNDVEGMSKELKKYDLEIVLEQRPRDVIVLENR